MGSGTSKQMSIPIVYPENTRNVSGLRFVQKQRQLIPKPYLQIEPNYATINRLETINSPVVHGVVGLRNLGNTCYFNTAINLLSHTQPLVDYFLSKAQKINSFSSTKGEVTKAFVQLLEQIWDDDNCFSESKDYSKLIHGQRLKPYNNCLNPIKLLNLLQKYSQRFKFGVQEDCQELMQYLLDLLHQELNRSLPKQKQQINDYTGDIINQEWAAQSWGEHLKINRSIIIDLFQGQLKSTIKCKTCNFQSHKFEPFQFLNLPIPKQNTTIYECFDMFQQSETLTDSCKWYCLNCKQLRDIEKSLQLWKLPNQLIIHFKRFEYHNRKQIKLNTFIDFPFELELDKYCVDQAISCYQLYAVAQHHGSSNNGHYVALCRAQNNNWYMYNDESVFRIQDIKKMIKNEYAYMLFYQRYDNVYRQTLNKPEAWPHFRLPAINNNKNQLQIHTDRNSIDYSTIQQTSKQSESTH